MKTITKIISYAMLILLAGVLILFLTGRMPLPQTQTWMLIATIGWFITASIWMWHKDQA